MIEFPCGCKVDPNNIDPYDLNEHCADTYKMLSRGLCRGVWQLETNFGKTQTKKLKPTELNDLIALGALLRPGVSEALDADGSTMMEKYCLRKNGQEEVMHIHPSLEPILKETYSVILYQEDATKICMDLANFSYNDSEVLRKAAGKKDTEKMAKVKQMFLDGAKARGILDEESANKIWAQMEASQRYAFNKCISGNTILKRAAVGGHKCVLSVSEMYKIRNDIEYAKNTGHISLYKKWKLAGNYGKGLSMHTDGRIRPNIIRDIQPAGIRTLYRITLLNGKYIDVTSNHKFPTETGIKICQELNIGNQLYVCSSYDKSGKKYGWSDDSIIDIRNKNKISQHDHIRIGFLSAEKNPGYTNGEYSKWLENSKKLPDKCDICSISNSRIEIHHKDGNRQNNELSNLQKLCPSHHKKEEYKLGRRKRGEKGYPSELVEIVSIEEIGVSETYDVTMDAPYHNFVTSEDIVTCNSHATAYGKYTYATAWFKCHFPLEFFCSYLGSAQEKSDPIEEKHELINEARLFDIQVMPPDFRFQQSNFHIKDKTIYFGMGNVKGIGLHKVKKLLKVCSEITQSLEDLSWLDIVVFVLSRIDNTTAENLILVGAFDYLGISRAKMHYEYNIWNQLTDKEKEWIESFKHSDDLLEVLQNAAKPKKLGGACSDKNRVAKLLELIKILEKPSFTLRDFPAKIAIDEQRLLGISLTAHESDDGAMEATCSCKEFLAGYSGNIVLAVTLTRVSEYITKKGSNPGQTMAFLTIEDLSCSLDSVIVFPEKYTQYKDILTENNVVLIHGKRSKTNSLIVERVNQI